MEYIQIENWVVVVMLEVNIVVEVMVVVVVTFKPNTMFSFLRLR